MIEKFSESRGWQVLVILALVLIVPLTVDINNRISVIRGMRQKEGQLQHELATARKEHAGLEAQLEFVKSDTYLEWWARVEARMTRPGEVAFIPLLKESTDQEGPASDAYPWLKDLSSSAPEQWYQPFKDETTTP